MPVRSDPASATQKWVQNLSSSTTAITNGVNRVQIAPGTQAAAQKTKWLQKITASADKWQQRVKSVSLQDWQQAMVNVGIPRIALGAQAKQGKFTNFMSEYLPYLARGVAQIDKMPSVTLEDSIARATAMIRYNAQFKRGGGSGS